MEGKCATEDMFSYQQNIDGMIFSIDQLDEQIGEIDKRLLKGVLSWSQN